MNGRKGKLKIFLGVTGVICLGMLVFFYILGKQAAPNEGAEKTDKKVEQESVKSQDLETSNKGENTSNSKVTENVVKQPKQKPVIKPVSTQPKKEEEKPAKGFYLYQDDKFSIQVPIDWKDVNVEYSYSIEDQFNTSINYEKKPALKTYEFKFLPDVDYNMDLTISPYDKSINPYEFLKKKEIMSDKFKEIIVTNADKAYEYINYNDDIREQSTRTLVVFKNNVFYELHASHEKAFSQGSFIDYDRNNIKKFRKDIQVMFTSFHIVGKGTTINEILKQ